MDFEYLLEIEFCLQISLKKWADFQNLYINLACLSGCLFVLYPINVKMAEPIGPTFFVGSRVTPERFMDDQIFKKNFSIKIRFLKILKIHKVFYKIREIFCFCFTMSSKKKCLQMK